MKILDRHIGTQTILGILLVLFILVILFSFFEFLAQINDLGKGSYQLKDALYFTALTVPRRMVDMMPLSILLGSIVALGLLADHFELVAMQAAGMSARRICGAVLAAGALVMVVAFVLAQYIAPPLEQHARLRRSKAIYGKGFMVTKTGFWTRRGHDFIHVGKTFSGGIATGIEIYQNDRRGRLRSYVYAARALIRPNGQWLLRQIEQKDFAANNITTRHPASLTLEAFIGPEQVGILELPPDSLSLSELYHYVLGLRASGQNAQRYALSLWKKLTLPLMNMVMVLLSLTFIFGPAGRITAGRRIVMASLVGIGLYLVNQIIGHVGLLLELPPALTTITPVAAVLVVALWLLSRTA